MKRLILIIILFFISTSIFAFNYKKYDQFLGLGAGYTTSYINFADKDIYLEGPSITLCANKYTKKRTKYSPYINYSISFLNSQTEGCNLNSEYPLKYQIESFLGIKDIFLKKNSLQFYVSYGLHTNLITLDSNETLWILFDIGMFASTGVSYIFNNDFFFDFGSSVSSDFFNMYITDYYFDEESFNIKENSSFQGFSGLVYCSLHYKI